MKLKEITDLLNTLAPHDWQESWDKSGLQIGDPEKEVKSLLLALDMNSPALAEAEAFGADLIVTHHPLFFNPPEALRAYVPEEALIRRLIKADIDVFSAHTNLDAAPWGVNYAMARALGFEEQLEAEPLFPLDGPKTPPEVYGNAGLYRQKKPGFAAIVRRKTERCELIESCKKSFSTQVQLNFSENAAVSRIVLSGGSWDGAWNGRLKEANVDAVICGEMKYHDRLACLERGIAVFCVGHGESEMPVLDVLADFLAERDALQLKVFKSLPWGSV